MKMKEKFITAWIDLEVTSFNAKKGGLTQISCIIERDGEEYDRINLYMDPSTYTRKVEILDANLIRSNRTREELETYPTSQSSFKLFKRFIQKNLKQNEILQLAGHNVTSHDSKFIQAWFEDNGEDMYDYFAYAKLDTLHLARWMRHWGMLDECKDDKLGTLCEFFGVNLKNWHNSIEDIEATRKMHKRMREVICKEF